MNRNDQNFIAQKIRAQYMEKDSSQQDLDRLRELDAEVKRPATVFVYVFGIIGAIIMGAGMSFVMTDIGKQLGISNSMPLGIVVGIVGLIMAVVNYPIYKAILSSRREKYSAQILNLSDKILGKDKN